MYVHICASNQRLTKPWCNPTISFTNTTNIQIYRWGRIICEYFSHNYHNSISEEKTIGNLHMVIQVRRPECVMRSTRRYRRRCYPAPPRREGCCNGVKWEDTNIRHLQNATIAPAIHCASYSGLLLYRLGKKRPSNTFGPWKQYHSTPFLQFVYPRWTNNMRRCNSVTSKIMIANEVCLISYILSFGQSCCRQNMRSIK